MNKTSKKRYVVWEGKSTGIFDNREDCKKVVAGYKNAKYKSFSSYKDALTAFSSSYKNYIGKEKKTIGPDDVGSISIDAACSGNPGVLQYRGVMTDSKKEIFSFGPYQDGTVNIGEFLALVEGIKYALKHNIKVIYSDSQTAISWLQNMKVNTTLEPTFANSHLFISLDEAISWLQSHQSLVQTIQVKKRQTGLRGEIPADYGRK